MGEMDPAIQERVDVDASLDHRTGAQLVEDARRGLTAARKKLPPIYLYDARGSQLFDAICDTPEYYPTRTEAALLESVAPEVMRRVRPVQLVELGSGAARKTRILLDALHDVGGEHYVPMDVSRDMLRLSAEGLAADYPWLNVSGLVGDYSETLSRLPAAERRLVAFLGGTIGNYEDAEADAFLSSIRAALGPEDALLLGADLVKDPDVLHAAYNDAAGLTAAFNKNLLAVLNRELGAEFDLGSFEHVAFYDRDQSQIEMHLRSLRDQTIRVRALDLVVHFREGETLHTEISRKFTRDGIAALFERSGFRLDGWFTPENDYFSLSLARPA
jgi:L-histidine N-alpha-methyltransferase